MSDDLFVRVRWAPYVRRAGCFAAAAIVLCAAAVSAAPTTVIFSAPRPILRIENGKPDGIGEIVIEASIAAGEGEIPKTPPAVSDDGPQETPPPPAAGATPAPPPTVRFIDTIETAASTATRRQWRVRAFLNFFPPAGTTMPRKLKITWGSFGTSTPLLYWASNVAPPAMTWKVTGLPTEWSASGSWCIPLRIAVTGPRATGILLTSTLVEQTTKKAMASPRLFLDPTGAAALEEAVNSQQQIKLCANGDASPGKYQGTLNVSAAEKPEGDPVTVALSVTTVKAIWIGIGLLALGCGLAYVMRVIAPARILRSQALLPATLIRDRAFALLENLDGALGRQPGVARQTNFALQKLIADLDVKALEAQNFVPRKIPSPLGAGIDAAKYKSLLDDSSAKLARLDVLVNEGFVLAVAIGGESPALPAVLTALDGFAIVDPPPALGALRKMVADEVTKLKDARAEGDAIERPQLTTETLTFQIEQTSILLWFGSLLLSFTIGLFVLILNNPAFGVPIDFLYCLLWGFGIPAVAGQLTPTAANTALGITLPKTTG